ncbi:unnamed protein product [Didymodactylos carnosus]|uniref:2-aminoethylphosphonate--pyruvate transaminase n=1 Tax=Didymodactylos carnosus TaxID=1234261 RepID=A0A814LKY7_9BILA|nr:unnamed protein product [Didymodactylos carnosus]CAF3834364.1 unnamed protein product [Didymodactylos carnosus]
MDVKEIDSKLFTPGPLTTSMTVKQAMLHDLGSRDTVFINIVAHIRQKLLEIADASSDDYTAVLIQGSGTYAVEATFSTSVPQKNAKVLIIENGAYGQRMIKMCDILHIDYDTLSFSETEQVNCKSVEEKLKSTKYTHVAVVHCETSSGILNPIEQIAALVQQYGSDNTAFIVDSMSAFGAIPVSLKNGLITFLISSANKCIEGIPGFAFVICKRAYLLKCQGNSRSLALDLYDQYQYMEKSRQFRFTPPTHAIIAFKQALDELEEEGQLIYPGKTTVTDCFRIGNIGRLYSTDMEILAKCIKDVCVEMNIDLPLKNVD